MIAAGLGVVVLAAVVAWTFPGRSPDNGSSSQRSSDQATTNSGDIFGRLAPAFSLPEVGGMTIPSDTLFAKPLVVLTFWSVECQTCQAQLEVLGGLKADSSFNATVAAVNRGDDSGRVKSVKDATDIDFSILLDRDGRVAAAYGANALPATFFIRQGTVVGVARGLLTADQLKSSVASLLREQ